MSSSEKRLGSARAAGGPGIGDLVAGALRIGNTPILFVILALFALVYWAGLGLVDLKATKGHIIGSDGLFYYEYLPSVVLDGDLDFSNQRALLIEQSVPYGWDIDILGKTKTGLYGTPFPSGWAVVTAPFFVAALALDHLFGLGLAETDHGYGFFYESITNFGAVLAGLLGCYFCFLTCRRESSERSALIIVISFLACTALPYYIVVQASMSHAVGFFAMSGALYFGLKPNKRLGDSIGLGIFSGLAFIVRPQLAPLLAALYLVVLLIDRRPKAMAIAVAAAIPVCAIQSLVWFLLYGSVFALAQGGGFLNPSDPHILGVLFSSRHGALLWHPILLLGLVALALSWNGPVTDNRRRHLILGLCLFAIVVQTYVNSIVFDWWSGNSFGNRRFIDIYPFFMIPLCLVLDRVRLRHPIAVASVLIALGLWNFLFFVQYRFCFIPRGEALTFQQFVIDKFQLMKAPRAYCS